MLLDLEQHPGIKALLALVQADKFGSKEAAAVWADGQTVPTLLQVGGSAASLCRCTASNAGDTLLGDAAMLHSFGPAAFTVWEGHGEWA